MPTTHTIATRQDFEALLASLQERATGTSRFVLGITGPPGAGKSTLAQAVAATLPRAVVVPMDGFHQPNSILEERGLLPLKGIPETFNGEGFVLLLQRIRRSLDEMLTAPAFDRAADRVVPNAITIEPAHRFIIVEGNYLLLDAPPWRQIPALLDEAWYVAVDWPVAFERLVARHVAGGRDRAAATEKVKSTDQLNAELIEQTRAQADRVLTIDYPLDTISDG